VRHLESSYIADGVVLSEQIQPRLGAVDVENNGCGFGRVDHLRQLHSRGGDADRIHGSGNGSQRSRSVSNGQVDLLFITQLRITKSLASRNHR
jgi:hypothetical protein